MYLTNLVIKQLPNETPLLNLVLKPGSRRNTFIKPYNETVTQRNTFIKPCNKPGTLSGENINLWASDALPTIMVVRFDESLTLTPKG